jgi:hypothetical protein
MRQFATIYIEIGVIHVLLEIVFKWHEQKRRWDDPRYPTALLLCAYVVAVIIWPSGWIVPIFRRIDHLRFGKCS